MGNANSLSHEQLLEVYKAAEVAGLVNCRAALLVGLPTGLVTGLGQHGAPGAQLLVDLDALNTVGALEDGTFPLAVWLMNAAALAGPRAEAGVFRRALEEIRRPVAPPQNPPVVAPAPPRAAPPGPREPRVIKSGTIEFVALEPRDLAEVAVVAQSLDNQWVPRAMLGKMLEAGLGLADVEVARERAVRSEYIRALVNAEQLVVNRAYLYNNSAVFNDYVAPGPARDAFKALLDAGVIVPFLFDEPTPVEKPGYETNPIGFSSWQDICGEVRARCVRLSWDDTANMAATRARLAGRFHEVSLAATARDADVYAQHLGLSSDAKPHFKKLLRKMADACLDFSDADKHITRNRLYQLFVIADSSSTEAGRYDRNKPFAGEIKQLIDLNYNINLPDALNRYALTPFDSLPRTALQEWNARGRKVEISMDDLKRLLQRKAFELVEGRLYFDTFARLELADVQLLRRTEEWGLYMESVRNLLQDPMSFSDDHAGAESIYRRFDALAATMTRLTERRSKSTQEPWTPVIEIDVDIAGGVISVQWGNEVTFRVKGLPSLTHGAGQAPTSVTLNIRDAAERSDQSDLATNVDFLRGQMEDARAQFEELRGYLASLSWMKELPVEENEDLQATLNQPEDE